MNDTRLVLSELLIQLQVFHSFDLGLLRLFNSSGLILLGVAATQESTLALHQYYCYFSDCPASFGARLPFPAGLSNQIDADLLLLLSPLSPRRLGIFFVIIVGLGLIILPFCPGFQAINYGHFR